MENLKENLLQILETIPNLPDKQQWIEKINAAEISDQLIQEVDSLIQDFLAKQEKEIQQIMSDADKQINQVLEDYKNSMHELKKQEIAKHDEAKLEEVRKKIQD